MAAIAVCYGEFQRRRVDVLAISTNTVNDHKVWNEVELSKMIPGGVPFPLLEDRSGAIARSYGLLDERGDMKARACFLVGPDGIIDAAALLIPQVGPGLKEFLRVIDACQYHRATGDSMPANWEPGQPAIKPSIQLAGHVWEVWQPGRTCK